MNARAIDRSPRLRVGPVLVAILLVLGVLVVSPHRASALTTVRTLTFTTDSFPVKDYMGMISVERNLSSRSVDFFFSLTKTASGTTTGGQAEESEQDHVFLSTWQTGRLSSPHDPTRPARMLASGTADSSTQMGSFGDATLHFAKMGSLVHRGSCGGKIQRYSRAVNATGTFMFNPDSPAATPYFGAVTETQFTGKLVFVINRNSGRPCRPPQDLCPTGTLLFYDNTTNPMVEQEWLAGPFTLSGITQDIFAGLVLDFSDPSVAVIRQLIVATPDGSWFSSQPDLSSAHADTSVLNLPSSVSGTTDYTYDGTAATSQRFVCGGAGFTDMTTKGTASAPITVTFEGGGSFANAAGAPAGMESVSPVAASGSRSIAERATLARTLRALAAATH